MSGYYDDLRRWTAEGKKIVLFCAGKHGVQIYKILQFCGIPVYAFSDMNPEKWNQNIVDQCRCLPPKDAAKLDDCLYFICIYMDRYREVLREVHNYGIQNIGSLNALFDDLLSEHLNLFLSLMSFASESLDDSILFYHEKPNREAVRRTAERRDEPSVWKEHVAVYTAIFGDYDVLHEPEYHSESVDYFLVSDICPPSCSAFTWIDAKSVVPANLKSPVLRNRYVKMHPHVLFQEYRHAVYMDGTITVKGDFRYFVSKPSKIGISPLSHPYADCLFYEAFKQCQFHRVSVEDTGAQIEHYRREGMPIHYGLPEMRVFGVDLQNPVAIEILDAWWEEFQRWALRDQFSFMYVLWDNNYSIQDISVFPWFYKLKKYFQLNLHNQDSFMVKNICLG